MVIPETDDELLLRVRADADAAAYGAFYRRYNRVILAFFVRRTPTPDVAADLTMEVFAAALQAAQVGTDPLPQYPAGWLFGIARHKLADSYRRREADSNARQRLRMEPMSLDDDDLRRIDELTDETRVLELLDALPEGQRDAVWRFVVEDRAHADIGEELGCSTFVVRQRVSRGLKALREQLEDER